jgi:hypothetical protein
MSDLMHLCISLQLKTSIYNNVNELMFIWKQINF